MRNSGIIVGLDIGTTKITTVIGEVLPGGSVDIIGQGVVPSEGMKRGSVVNLERATQAIRQSVQAAERVAGVRVNSAFVSVAGNHAKAITSHGLAAIRRNQAINQSDVDRAIENARAVPLDPNLEILHTLPQEYVVDGQEGIKNPVSMHGVRLEVDVHIVAGTAGPLLNLRRCVQEAGLQVEGFVLHALASGLATLDATEQQQTTIVIDMGGGTTDIGVFKRGNLAHSASIPIGGEHVTADLAQILKIPMEEAENVKKRYGAAVPELADPDLALEITSANGQTHALSAFELSRIIKPRIAEIFGLIREEIDQALGPAELVAQSVVLTGGAAQLRGVVDLARDRFRLQTRLGQPRGIGGLSDIVSGPEYAASVGLVLYGIGQDGRIPESVLQSGVQGGLQSGLQSGLSNGLQGGFQNAGGGSLQPAASASAPVAAGTPPTTQQVIAAAPQAADTGRSGQTSPQTSQQAAPVPPVVITSAKEDAAPPTKPQKAPKAEKPQQTGSLGDRVRNFFKDWF